MISPFLQKLMFVRQFNIADGKVSVLGENYVMFDALALLEIQKIDQTKLYDALKGSAFRNISEAVKSAQVYKNVKDTFVKDIAKLGAKIGQTDKGTLGTLQELFNVYGLGNMQILSLNNDKKQATVRISDSTIAGEYVKKYRKSAVPVDVIAAAVLAGIFSFVFKKQVDCVEQRCLAQGNAACQFEIA